MKAQAELTHCFKHARTHSADRPCTDCLVEKIVRGYIAEQHPHANRVTHPELMREMEEWK